MSTNINLKNSTDTTFSITHSDGANTKVLDSKDIAVAIDTVADFPANPNNGDVVIVRDLNRGGTFIYDSSEVAGSNDGTNFDGWIRQYSGAVSVKWFGANETRTDNQVPIESAIVFAFSINGGEVYIPDGIYQLSNYISIPFSTGWKLCGSSRGGTTLKQTTNNTPIFKFIGNLTHSWIVSDISFDYLSSQPSTNTLAVAIYFSTGVSSNNIFNFQIARCSFYNSFRAIASSTGNSPLIWGARVYDCNFGGTLSGGSFVIVPTPAGGQPNINIYNCYIDATSAKEPSINVGSGDNVTIQNVEFNNGSYANNPNGLVSVQACKNVSMINTKSEAFLFGSSSMNLFVFAGSDATIINCSVNGFTGTGYPRIFSCSTGGKLSILGSWITSSMTGGTALAYYADTITMVSNLYLQGFVTKNLRSILGNVPMPNIDTDATSANEYTNRGDVSVTLTSADYQLQLFNTTLTANRTVTLPSTGLFTGMRFRIVRRHSTPGAFTLAVSDPISGQNYTIPSNTNGFVEYHATSTGSWFPIAAGIL